MKFFYLILITRISTENLFSGKSFLTSKKQETEIPKTNEDVKRRLITRLVTKENT
jgi:hypothetical protein